MSEEFPGCQQGHPADNCKTINRHLSKEASIPRHCHVYWLNPVVGPTHSGSSSHGTQTQVKSRSVCALVPISPAFSTGHEALHQAWCLQGPCACPIGLVFSTPVPSEHPWVSSRNTPESSDSISGLSEAGALTHSPTHEVGLHASSFDRSPEPSCGSHYLVTLSSLLTSLTRSCSSFTYDWAPKTLRRPPSLWQSIGQTHPEGRRACLAHSFRGLNACGPH